MNRPELSAQLAAQFSLDKASADRMVTVVFAAIGDSLANGEAVSIAGFGTFATKSRPARQGRNPGTGEAIEIASSTAPAVQARQGASRRGQYRAGLTAHSQTAPLSQQDSLA